MRPKESNLIDSDNEMIDRILFRLVLIDHVGEKSRNGDKVIIKRNRLLISEAW